MERKSFLRIIGLSLILVLVGTACGTTSESAADDPAQEKPAASTETGAAALRSTLATTLQEHEYLAGIAIYAAVNTGLDSPVTNAAKKTLDQNTVALGEAIGSIYGADAEKAFLPLWRKHIGFFVDYTVAGAQGNEAGQRQAKEDLDGYRGDFGAFLASANPNLTKDAVADALVPHVDSTFDAIDSVLAKSPKAFSKLRVGAEKLGPVAEVLAGAIAKQKPDMFDGDASSGASGLRSTLSTALQEHEYLAGIAIFNAVNFGMENKMTEGSIAALDENTVGLGKAIGSVYGGDAEKSFLPLWRKHIGFFVDYTLAGGKGAKAAKAKADLNGYRGDFGAFLASANPNLTKDAVADALVPHVNTTFDAIDAVLAKSPKQFSKLRQAAGELPAVGNVLAGAIVKQFPEKFA